MLKAPGAPFVKDVDGTMKALRTRANGFRMRHDSADADTLFNVYSVIGNIFAKNISCVITWGSTGGLTAGRRGRSL